MEKKIKLNSGNYKISCVLQTPEKIKKAPVVIMCHGLCSSKNSRKIQELKTRMLKNKISVFTFDFAHHGESEGKPEELTVTQSLQDLKTAIEYVKSLPTTKNIALTGSSYGGLISSLTASELQELSALVLIAPLTNPEKTFAHMYDIIEWEKKGFVERKNFKDVTIKLNYSFYEDGKKYNTLNLAERIKAPTLIIHGDSDKTVPIDFSRCLHEKLTCEKEFKILEGEDHYFDNSFEQVMNESENWLMKHLTK